MITRLFAANDPHRADPGRRNRARGKGKLGGRSNPHQLGRGARGGRPFVAVTDRRHPGRRKTELIGSEFVSFSRTRERKRLPPGPGWAAPPRQGGGGGGKKFGSSRRYGHARCFLDGDRLTCPCRRRTRLLRGPAIAVPLRTEVGGHRGRVSGVRVMRGSSPATNKDFSNPDRRGQFPGEDLYYRLNMKRVPILLPTIAGGGPAIFAPPAARGCPFLKTGPRQGEGPARRQLTAEAAGTFLSRQFLERELSGELQGTSSNRMALSGA